MDTGDKLLLELGNYSYFEKLDLKSIEKIEDMIESSSKDCQRGIIDAVLGYFFKECPEIAVQLSKRWGYTSYEWRIEFQNLLIWFWNENGDDDFLLYSLKYLGQETKNCHPLKYEEPMFTGVNLAMLALEKYRKGEDILLLFPETIIEIGTIVSLDRLFLTI